MHTAPKATVGFAPLSQGNTHRSQPSHPTVRQRTLKVSTTITHARPRVCLHGGTALPTSAHASDAPTPTPDAQARASGSTGMHTAGLGERRPTMREQKK